MAESGRSMDVGGQAIAGYYGLGEETEAFVRKLMVETRTLQQWEVDAMAKIRGTYLVSIDEDGHGNVLVAFRGESPINPSAQEPSPV